MTTCQQIVTDALRETNLIEIGGVPDSAQSVEGMRRLNVIVASVFGNDVGERLEPWIVGNIPSMPLWNSTVWQYLRGDYRVYVNTNAVQSLYMPASPQDGDRIALLDVNSAFAAYPVTLMTNGKRVEGSTNNFVANTNGFNRTWIYMADDGDWKKISDLALTDTFPFPTAVEDAFVTGLALRLNPRYGQSIKPETQVALQRSLNQLRARYRRKNSTPVGPATLLMPGAGSSYARSDGNPYPYPYPPFIWT